MTAVLQYCDFKQWARAGASRNLRDITDSRCKYGDPMPAEINISSNFQATVPQNI